MPELPNKVALNENQLQALDSLIARGKDIPVDELPRPGTAAWTDCWLDTAGHVVNAVLVVTEIATCASAVYEPELNAQTGKKAYSLS
jgi:hypothetical protein